MFSAAPPLVLAVDDSAPPPGWALEQFLRCNLSALNEGLQLGPRDLVVQATTEAAVGRGDDVFWTDQLGELDDAVSN